MTFLVLIFAFVLAGVVLHGFVEVLNKEEREGQ